MKNNIIPVKDALFQSKDIIQLDRPEHFFGVVGAGTVFLARDFAFSISAEDIVYWYCGDMYEFDLKLRSREESTEAELASSSD